jgi:hypothetical protein
VISPPFVQGKQRGISRGYFNLQVCLADEVISEADPIPSLGEFENGEDKY